MKHTATRDLFAYWNDLRAARSAPERSEIDPAAIRHVLADTFMLDVDVAQKFAFRLAGTRVNGLFDDEQKGRSFLDLWRPEERRNVAAILLTVADGACPVVAGGVAAPRGHEDCHFELLFLPLRHHGKTHSRILGVVTTATRPAWLGMLPLGPLTLRSLRIVDESERERPRIAVGQEGPLSDGPADSLEIAGGMVRPGRPTLRLIRGGLS